MKNLSQVSLAGLRVVEAVGRLGSLKNASEELGITSGAISQQLHKTEDQLGRPLFLREPGGLKLTNLGEEICRGLSLGLKQISQAVALADRDREESLFLSVAPLLAEKWLVWRLKSFMEANPDINLRLDANDQLINLNHSDADACVRVHKRAPEDVYSERLCEHFIYPVCSPEVASRLKDPQDLLSEGVIRDYNSYYKWSDWLAPFGLKESQLPKGHGFSNASLCMDAAIAGHGVFLGWDTLVANAVKQGQLVIPFKHRCSTGRFYWFICREGALRNQSVRKLRDWLKEEIAQTAVEYENL
ncbi:LysR substrate-binding domain-containing protein [Pseudovibrio sp. Tun.PSC04-5.I4]|uniref:LysR substrate-binding domain-containing protein n=1 Tax=Pseudovibrio sp. Tun.PSC04-5.I4 TaxID=1798213 RepID=UPI0008897E47|nr:LysR substrate-binding domain-containing protein [Pseudovibrio sp. Tun.PSC04-5.I4]SDQ81041.1 DNA-binding transcriptional regulator, LysR family [Pseudovibrio sp. Tun.PSC04-5.I4]